jgi:hypothetical protein
MFNVDAFLHWLCFQRRFVALAADRLQNPTSRTDGSSFSRFARCLERLGDYRGLAIRVTMDQSVKYQ